MVRRNKTELAITLLKGISAAGLLALVSIAFVEASYALSPAARSRISTPQSVQNLVHREASECSGHNGLLHHVRTFPTSRVRACSQNQNSAEYAACRATGYIRCATGGVGTGVVLDITGNVEPGFLGSAAHTLFNTDGSPKRDCFFYPYQWPDMRVPIVSARHQLGRTQNGELDWDVGDVAIARLGTVQLKTTRGGRTSWANDRTPAVEYTGALAIGTVEDAARLSPGVDPSIRQIGYDPRRRDISVSDNCTAYVHDVTRDTTQFQSQWKSNCTAPVGWSGGPLIRTVNGENRVLCIQSRESHPLNQNSLHFSRDQYFNLCTPLPGTFSSMAIAFARERPQYSSR